MVVPGTPSEAATPPLAPALTPLPTSPAPIGSVTPEPTPSPGENGDGEEGEDAGENPAVPRDPLRVDIEQLTPGALPERGKVRVSGTITNVSDDEWTDLAVYLFTSVEPITTTTELEVAMASDPRTDIGDRIVEPGLFTEAADLAPGERSSFDLAVPVDELLISGTAGVYWIGVHVLGTNPTGRLEGADGRARTFVPLVPERTEGAELAMAMQFRNHIVRSPDGRLEYLEGWQDSLAEEGRLRRLLDLGATAGLRQPLGWVVDPAVVDAARAVADGNPALELAPDGEPEDGKDSDDSEEGAPSEEDSEVTDAADSDVTPKQSAAAWVEDFFEEAADHSLLSLPYGDLDVSSVVRHGVSDLLTAAFESSTLVLEDRELTSTPMLLPPHGLLAPEAFAELEPGLPVVLSPTAMDQRADSSILNRLDGGRIVLAPGPEDMWGPGPGATRSALAVRQRLLADAALHALSDGRDEPLVRFLPRAGTPARGGSGPDSSRGSRCPG
jgi:hypothetical protein